LSLEDQLKWKQKNADADLAVCGPAIRQLQLFASSTVSAQMINLAAQWMVFAERAERRRAAGTAPASRRLTGHGVTGNNATFAMSLATGLLIA
jgi:hypothetical protein